MRIELVKRNGCPYHGTYLYRVANSVFINLSLEFLNEEEARDFTRKVEKNIKTICKEILNNLIDNH